MEFLCLYFPNEGMSYGKKREDGSWTGMIGDLANGDTDLIVADLTMTSGIIYTMTSL